MSKSMRPSLLLVLCLSGCTVFSKAHTHVEYTGSSGKTMLVHVAHGGQYALYINNDPIPAVVQLLKKSDTFGFEKNDEERIRAVGGNYSTVLPRNTKIAVWKPLPYSSR